MRPHLHALQRRQAKQRLARALPLAVAGELPINIAASQAARLQADEFEAIYRPKRAAFHDMRAGRGSLAAWNELADAMNLSIALAAMQIASNHAATFQAASEALAELLQRQRQTGRWTLRGPEIAALDLAVQVHRIQLQLCSRGELKQAFDTVIARAQAALRGDHAPGVAVIDPGQPTATTATA